VYVRMSIELHGSSAVKF